LNRQRDGRVGPSVPRPSHAPGTRSPAILRSETDRTH